MLKRKIVIDTDPGIDDTIALTAAINSELNIELVTTVFGNVNLEQTTINALRILEFLGKDIPVAKGVPRALFFDPGIDGSHVHGIDGLGGYPMPYPKTKVVYQVAVGFSMLNKFLCCAMPRKRRGLRLQRKRFYAQVSRIFLTKNGQFLTK